MAYNAENELDERDEDESEDEEEGDESVLPEGLAEAFPDLVRDAIAYMEEAHEEDLTNLTEMYKGDTPAISQEDFDDGRSDIVSRDVHDAVQAAMPDLVRAFLGDDRVLEFMPGGKDDDAYAEQATDAIRHIFLKENDAFRFIHGSLKDGLVRRFAVAAWWHEVKDVSTTREYFVDADTYATLLERDGEVEVVHSKTIEPEEEGEPPMIEATLRHKRTVHRFCVEQVPPEELIVSRRARDSSGRHLIGRQQNLPPEELIGMGIDEELVKPHIGSGDEKIRTSQLAAERAPESQTGSDENEARDVLYVETYLTWPHEDRMQLFKVCAIGTSHNIVSCEPVDCIDMALWTPDPEPHTAIGEGWAEKVSDIQRLKTGVWRGIVDSLAEALVPRTEVVEQHTNIDDALSTEIGGIVRVRQANSVRPISTPFVGQQAMPLLEAIDHMREERVGAFRAADGLSAETMQSSTKIAVAATISGSKAQKELLAYGFAWTYLRVIFRGLLRLFVENQDQAKWIRMRGEWVQVDPRGWNADMDCTVDVALAMSTVEERVQFLMGIAEKQEQILQTLGPINPLCHLGHYAHTLRSLVALGGYRNKDAFFANLPLDPQQIQQLMPQQEPQVDPLVQAQVQALQQDQQRKAQESQAKMALDQQRLKMDDDFRRDELDQKRELELAKIAAEYAYDTSAHEADIEADIAKNRDGLMVQAGQQALQATMQPPEPQQPPAGEGAQPGAQK